MLNLKSIKTQLIIYLLILAFFLSINEKSFILLVSLFFAVSGAVLAESIIIYLKKKTLEISESSIVTGIIIGYVLSADQGWWKFVAAAVLAIISKYVICFQKKHIFNPAAFGIMLALALFRGSTVWHGTYLWYVLVPFGIYFTRKIEKLEVIIGYAIISIFLFGTQTILLKLPIWNIFGYFSYFFIFIMLIEPKTSPLNPRGKYLFGGSVALLIFILTEMGARFDVELFSLLAMNAAVPLLNRWFLKRGGVV